MAWDRRLPDKAVAPAPIALGRWLVAAGVAVLVGVLVFLLLASGRVPLMQGLNIWALAAVPLFIWVLVFSARAYAYGQDLSHYQFLEHEARIAEHAWHDWAQRGLAVNASCVLLPDQVSAAVLAQSASTLPPRGGQVRRIAALPLQGSRTQAGLQQLIAAMTPALRSLPAGQELRVTLLSDGAPEDHSVLHLAWQQIWGASMGDAALPTLMVSDELSCQWLDDTVKSASTALQLLLVLQVNGAADYSDGLAALLLCPDPLATLWKLPVTATLLRPMPLDVDALASELPLFWQTQTAALCATAVLADAESWQPVMTQLVTTGRAQGAQLEVEQQWVQERFCGLAGPLGHWLVTALGVEVSRHQQRPLMLLATEKNRQWISTVTHKELA